MWQDGTSTTVFGGPAAVSSSSLTTEPCLATGSQHPAVVSRGLFAPGYYAGGLDSMPVSFLRGITGLLNHREGPFGVTTPSKPVGSRTTEQDLEAR